MFKNMSIGKKIGLTAFIVSLVSLIVVVVTFSIIKVQIKKEVHQEFVKNLQEETNAKFQTKKAVGISNAVSVANDGKIKEALRLNDRKLAIDSLKDLGKRLKASTPFKNIKIHVHTKDNHSFVRIWKISKYGDDLSGFRHSVVKVNQTNKAVNTFELGKAGLSLRSVVPVIDNNGEHLGSLEFMQGLNSVAKAFNKHKDGFVLLMDKRKSSVKTFKASKIFKENYIISQKFINQDFIDDAQNINMEQLLKDKSFTTDKYLYTYVDVKNFRKEKLGIAITGSLLSKVDVAVDSASEIANISIYVIVAMIILIQLVLIIGIKRIITNPLMVFQNGIIEFFKYLNKEVPTIKQLDSKNDDEIGIMAKIVNENIVKTQNLIEQDEAVINDVKRVVSLVKDGYIKQTIDKSTQNIGLEELKTIFNEMLEVISSKVSTDINKIKVTLDEFHKLNFSHRIPQANGEVEVALNSLADIINKMLVDNKSNGMTLQSSSDILLDNVSALSSSSNQAAASLEETAAALEEITSNITNNTDNVIQMASHGNEVKSSVEKGQGLANHTTTAMDEINTEVTAISEAISVIDQISFQTNILSLNAAVEAATAGEAGKGFAVVAQEVRNLASRSAEAANEIKTLVENARTKADDGKKIADEMIEGYTSLNESISRTLELISDVESASKEQQKGIEQINNAVTELDQQTQQNASVANATKDVAVQTQQIAHDIVDDANEKEFIGKDGVKAKSVNHNPVVVNKTQKTQVQPSISPKVRVQSKPITMPKVKAQIKPIVASKNSDDEWESF